MRILLAIPACVNLVYSQWESTESPHFDPSNAYQGKGYGERIHISGPNDRIQAIRDTWAKDVPPEMDLGFFYGNPDVALHDVDLAMAAIPKPVTYKDYGKTYRALPGGGFREIMPEDVLLDVPDDYEHLPQKVIAICQWAVEQDYDWMLKADDDTYIWPARALEEIQHKQWSYAGYQAHIGGYLSGGPGYWLSRRAMEIIAGVTPWTWAEDMVVGETLLKSGIKGVALNKTHLCGLQHHWINIETADLSSAVTAHAVKVEDMRAIYAREHA
jgi:Galactosyltransferase